MFNKLKTGVSDLAGKAGELKNLGGDLIQTTAAEFNAVVPLFGRIGYRVGKVQIEIGLSPKINFQLRHVASVDESEFDALLAEHQGNRVLSTIVAALRQASALQAKVQFRGFRFDEVEVEMGIPPAIKLAFREEGALDDPPAPRSVAIPSLPPIELAPLAPPAPPAPAIVPEERPVASEEVASRAERDRLREEEIEALARSGLVVRFECNGCGKKLVMRAEHAGREGECRRCGTVHVIPAPTV